MIGEVTPWYKYDSSLLHTDEYAALQEKEVQYTAKERSKEGGLDLRESELIYATDRIQMKFQTLVTKTRRDMEKQGLTPNDIAYHLEGFPELEPV